eukprot:543348-Pleurochrysis_carterae.AAC.2
MIQCETVEIIVARMEQGQHARPSFVIAMWLNRAKMLAQSTGKRDIVTLQGTCALIAGQTFAAL